MPEARHIAIIDVGKTNAKVTLVAAADATELARRSAANRVLTGGPYPHFDVAHLWDFICGALTELNREAPVDAISVTAHGSAGAFLSGEADGEGLALPILDYEFEGPAELADEYDAVRPSFSESFSPRLPAGLNLGSQVFWQERRFADTVENASCYVNYPQYWAWRLTGIAATEMCSMGAHSDMWDPRALTWSSLVRRLNWQRFLAPLRSAFDVLGPLRPDLARRLGLGPETPVLCGIHDSSASLLPHIIEKEPPFTVVSTGTWTIIFAVGGDLDRLDPKRDTLANVTALGDPVPCARFMGGREFERLVDGSPAEPAASDIDRVIGERIMALPAFAPGVGPFPDGEGRWTHPPETLPPDERTAAAGLYLALVTATSMACASAAGPTIVEGPFAANRAYTSALAALTGRPVLPSGATGGTTRGATYLLDRTRRLLPTEAPPAAPLTAEGFARYAEEWRKLAGG